MSTERPLIFHSQSVRSILANSTVFEISAVVPKLEIISFTFVEWPMSDKNGQSRPVLSIFGSLRSPTANKMLNMIKNTNSFVFIRLIIACQLKKSLFGSDEWSGCDQWSKQVTKFSLKNDQNWFLWRTDDWLIDWMLKKGANPHLTHFSAKNSFLSLQWTVVKLKNEIFAKSSKKMVKIIFFLIEWN